MGTYLHRTTKRYLQSVSPGQLPEPLANYIDAPDMTGVVGVPSKYWVIAGDIVNEMNQAEKDAVDAQIVSDGRDSTIAEVENLEGILRQIVKLTLSEINILRTEHGLPARTMSQFKTQMRNGLGS